jgi:hypothetical protein
LRAQRDLSLRTEWRECLQRRSRTMKLHFLILTGEILLFCGWMQSQETVPLRVVEQHNSVTVQKDVPLFNYVQCDATRNVYFLTVSHPSTVLTVLHYFSMQFMT